MNARWRGMRGLIGVTEVRVAVTQVRLTFVAPESITGFSFLLGMNNAC